MPPNKNLTRWANFHKLKPDLRLAARGGMSHAALPEEVRQRDKLQLEYKKGGQCPPLAVYQFARLSYRFSLLPQRQMLWLSRRITKVS